MITATRPFIAGTDNGVISAPVALVQPVLTQALWQQPDVAALSVLAAGQHRVELFMRSWIDVTADVRELQTDRGIRRVGGITRRTEAGTATVTLGNLARAYDPTVNSDLYTGVLMRITCSDGTAMQPVFYGRIEGIAVEYGAKGFDATSTLSAVDAVTALAQRKLATIAAVGAGDTASQRISRILDAAGWPSTARDISTGGTTLAATTMGQSAWDLICDAVDAEVGDCWAKADGTIAFRTFAQALSGAASAAFADNGTGYAYTEIAVAYDDDNARNQVEYALAGSSTVTTITDTDAVTKYTQSIPVTLSDKSLPHSTQTLADAWASLALYVLATPELRIEKIQVVPVTQAGLPTSVLALDVSSRVTVRFQPPGGGAPISQSAWVRGISHYRRADTPWTVTLTLGSASRYRFLTLDDADLGKLDSWAMVDSAQTFTGGRYVSVSGSVVPRPDINQLANQMVMVFPSYAAVTAAITSPTVGMQVQITSPFERRFYNGVGWVKA
jgi:hypothetical protein